MRASRAVATASVLAIVIAAALVGSVILYALSPAPTSPKVQTSSNSSQQASSVSTVTSASQPASSSSSATTVTNVVTTVTSATFSTATNSWIATTQLGAPGAADVVQSCAGFGNNSMTSSCLLENPVHAGNLILVDVAEVAGGQGVGGLAPPSNFTSTLNQSQSRGFALSDSLNDNFTMVGQAPGQPGNTYTFYFFAANATTGGTERVTLTGQGAYPFIFVHELKNVSRVVGFSSGRGDSTSASVSPIESPPGSFVLAAIWVENDRGIMMAGVVPGVGGTLLDSAFAVTEEYSTAGGNMASPFSLTSGVPWGEISVALD